MSDKGLPASRALWNRTTLDLRSDEVLAQLLDRGEMSVWRELYLLAKEDVELRQRLHRVVLTVPTPLPRFWLAALASIGERVDLGARVPEYDPSAV